MKKSIRRIITIILTLSVLFTFNSIGLAKNLPKYIELERKEFLRDQLTPKEEIFLEKLETTLLDLANINEKTLVLFESVFPKKKKIKVVNKNLRAAAKKSIRILTKRKGSATETEKIINEHFSGNIELKESLQALIADFKKYTKGITLKGNFTPFADGSYQYYTYSQNSFTKAFGQSLQEILINTKVAYREIINPIKEYQLPRSSNALEQSAGYFAKAQLILETEIIERVELASSGWAKKLLLEMTKTVQKQLKLNEEMNRNLAAKISKIIVSEPNLPDLKVIDIEISIPKDFKVGKKVTVIAEIKNIGQLTVKQSKMQITFPDGKKRRKSIPKLEGNQAYKVKYRYRVKKSGTNTFEVITNSKNKAWEVNTNNNKTKRSLILAK